MTMFNLKNGLIFGSVVLLILLTVFYYKKHKAASNEVSGTYLKKTVGADGSISYDEN